MKKQIFIGLLSLFIVLCGCVQTKNEDGIPLAPQKYRRPDNFQPFSYEYSLAEMRDKYSEEMMERAAKQYETVMDVNKKGKWKATPESLDSHQTPEWFLDAKFGMFIDWGLWSVAGWAPKEEEGAMYPDWYESRINTHPAYTKYHEKNWGSDFMRDDFIPLFTASAYQPEKLVSIAKEAGMKYIVPFSKHHGGFCLWESSYTYRDAVDMGPRRDLIRPLIESCREEGLKFGFYFSLEEWDYPLINEEGVLINRNWIDRPPRLEPYTEVLEKKCSGKIAVKKYAEDYLIPQGTEFIDKYDPDILWYDGEWETPVQVTRSYDIAAYLYNKAEGRKEVAVNDRYGLDADGKKLRFIRGDIFTSEFHDNEDADRTHAWEENRGISQSYGFNWQDTEENVISSAEFVTMFVDIVSRGGNLLLIVNLDGQGALPDVQERRLKEIGQWLKVNAEGIYDTRMHSTTAEGDVRYTRSKDRQTVFAITTQWPGKKLELKSIVPKEGSDIHLLGIEEPCKWSYDKEQQSLIVFIPEDLQDEANRPCNYAYTFKIQLEGAGQ